MNKLIPSLELGAQLQMVVAVIFGILIISSVIFSAWKKLKPGAFIEELVVRLKSWWVICFVFLFAALAGPMTTCIGLGVLSFFALRELYTHLKLPDSDRSILLVCYLCIPVQYYFA